MWSNDRFFGVKQKIKFFEKRNLITNFANADRSAEARSRVKAGGSADIIS